MKKVLITLGMVGCLATPTFAGDLDFGARYGQVPSESGSTSEFFMRYRIYPMISFGASIAKSELTFNQNGQTKKVESTPVGATVTVHVPFIPLVKPYIGAGAQYYTQQTVTSTGSDLSKERSSTATLHAGADLFAPFPGLSFNLEVRRLVGDQKNQVFVGALFKF